MPSAQNRFLGEQIVPRGTDSVTRGTDLVPRGTDFSVLGKLVPRRNTLFSAAILIAVHELISTTSQAEHN